MLSVNCNNIKFLMRKELNGYFSSPIGYVIISVYILLTFGTTFFIGNFFGAGQASLRSMFLFQPWIFLFLISAIGMRLWAEEKNTGTIELLFTLPIRTPEMVISKFLAGWLFAGLALLLTFPLFITVVFLGSPDLGQIFSGYLGAFLMCGAYLSVCCLTSCLTRNQVISFVLSISFNFLILLIGWGVLTETLSSILPISFVDALAFFSYSSRFESISRGVIDSRDLIYFGSFIITMLFFNTLLLDNLKKK